MRQKFQVTVIAKDYWTVELEAEDEADRRSVGENKTVFQSDV